MEHTTTGREGLGTAAITEQPIMAQALEATGEHMQQEAPDELGSREAHHLDGVTLPIIAPAEVDDAVLHSDETLMADSDPMGRAPEVRHHLLGAGERSHCILPITSPKRWLFTTPFILWLDKPSPPIGPKPSRASSTTGS